MQRILMAFASVIFVASLAKIKAQASDQPLIQRVDAHPYRHCHSIERFVYCHKKERLPRNWPPLTDTPHGKTYDTPNQPPPRLKRQRNDVKYC